MDKNLIIGITGNYASGKTTASKYFITQGFINIELDNLGHQALVEKKEEIISTFGKKILNKNNISKSKLGKIVFKNEKKLRLLEKILHPQIKKLVKQNIKKNQNKNIILSGALIIELNLNKLCNKLILISSSKEKIIQRAIKRDSLKKEEILNRLNFQLPIKNSLPYADFHINNNSTKLNLKVKCNQIIKIIKTGRSCENPPKQIKCK